MDPKIPFFDFGWSKQTHEKHFQCNIYTNVDVKEIQVPVFVSFFSNDKNAPALGVNNGRGSTIILANFDYYI